jgi:hypothetical protein
LRNRLLDQSRVLLCLIICVVEGSVQKTKEAWLGVLYPSQSVSQTSQKQTLDDNDVFYSYLQCSVRIIRSHHVSLCT